MKSYVIYNEKGDILKFGVTSKSVEHLLLGNGEFAAEGKGDDLLNKVVDGRIIKKKQKEI